MAVFTTYPQETVFETATFQVRLERTLDIARQYTAPRRHMGGESRVVLFDNLIQKGLFRPVTLVKTSVTDLGGIPCRRGTGHDSRPCDTLFVTSLSLATWVRKGKANSG